MDRYAFAETKLLKADRIIIDTSSLMELTALSAFVDIYSNILLSKRIHVFSSVYSELIKHDISHDNQKQILASKALYYLHHHSQYFILDEKTELSYNPKCFADIEILEYLISTRRNYVTLLITQDRNLASDAMSLNNLSSCYGHKILVCRLDNLGFFQTFTHNPIPKDFKATESREGSTKNPSEAKRNDSSFSGCEFAIGIATGLLLPVFGKRLSKLLRR